MRISVPTEIKNNEYRVALTPSGVHDLAVAGHEVFVQRGAGAGSSMTDAEYEEAGATLLDGRSEPQQGGDAFGQGGGGQEPGSGVSGAHRSQPHHPLGSLSSSAGQDPGGRCWRK